MAAGDAAVWSRARCRHLQCCCECTEKGAQGQQVPSPLGIDAAVCLVPDVITYGAAVSACQKGAQWQQALGLLAWMQQSGLVPNVRQQVTQLSGPVPDVVTYNTAVSAHEQGSQ
jgi:hypothetical protein